MGHKSRKPSSLEQAGLMAIADALKHIPALTDEARSNWGFRHFLRHPAPAGVALPGEVIETELPLKLKGCLPLGIAVSKPVGARTIRFKIEKLNPDEPFRRFEEVLVTYTVIRKGQLPNVRETIYYKKREENHETLESLARRFADQASRQAQPRPKMDKSFYAYSQWSDAYLEFEEYQGHVQLLSNLEEGLGAFGSALRHLIMYHAELAYHLGLRVREAELVEFQNKIAAVRSGGGTGGRSRAKIAKSNAITWQAEFLKWLESEVSQGRVKAWWSVHKKQGERGDSVETLCRYARDCWPQGGFRGAEKKTQFKPLEPRTLRKIITPMRRRLTSQGA